MKKLTLPEPAARLWLATRDVLNQLGPAQAPWTPYLGGGTIIAARIGHRESTDIDVSAIARKAEVDRVALSRGLSGNRDPRLGTVTKIAAACGVSLRFVQREATK